MGSFGEPAFMRCRPKLDSLPDERPRFSRFGPCNIQTGLYNSGMDKARTKKTEARQRIVETAERLFYAEGIRAVGIDRIIAEAEVAKMTLYNHFSSKDDLILAVLKYRHDINAVIGGQLLRLKILVGFVRESRIINRNVNQS